MNWVTVIWSMVAATCVTLAVMHLVIWIKQRDVWSHFLFFSSAMSAALVAGFELALIFAQSPAQFATLYRWAHVPVCGVVISIVWFVRNYLRAGRPWLAWGVTGVRLLALVLNFSYGVNLNYLSISSLNHTKFLGEMIALPVGVPNPLMLFGQLSSLLLLIFLVDATRTVWRRGDRRHALVVGGSMILFITAAAVQVGLVNWGVLQMPTLIGIAYLFIIIAMANELSTDVFRAADLSRKLMASEKSLDETGRRMDLAARAADLAMWNWDIVRDEIWTTEWGRTLFGVAPQERLNLSRYLQFLHPDDRQPLTRSITESMKGDGDYKSEYRVVTPDGEIRWIAGHGRVEFNSDGKAILLRGVSMDITARKRAEESLRESEARFRTLANTAPVMIRQSDPDKRFTFFNKGWLEFSGRTLEQELEKGWAEGVQTDDRERYLQVYGEAFDARHEFTIEYRLQRHDGEYRWVLENGVPRFDSNMEFLGYVGTAVDVTEIKLAQDRFRQVVEAAPSAMIMVGPNGLIDLVNAQLEAVFGYGRAELIGEPIELLFPKRYLDPAHREERIGAAANYRPAGTGRELYGRRKNGGQVPIEISSNPMRTPEGLFVLASIIDITERRRAEMEALQQRNELAHLSRVTMLGELSGSLAHELNQPLTAILSNAQAAQRFLDHNDIDLVEVRAILKDIVEDDKRAGEVIRRLRLLLKKGEVLEEPVDVNELVRDVLKLVNSDLLNHGVMVDTHYELGLPAINGDRVQLLQVLLNLIMNACDAMLHVEGKDRKLSLRTEMADGDEGVQIVVVDHGCGIPSSQVQRVFEPFFTTKQQGMGLGLSVCRTIITAHRGRLWAANNADCGASFYIAIPAHEEMEVSDEIDRTQSLHR